MARHYGTQRSTFVKASLVWWFLTGILAVPVARAAENVDVRIYSEFQRFDPFGNPLAQDRETAPREILSPAVARNGHLSVHVVVTAPEGANFFVYTGSNPPDILELKLYREYFSRCGDGYCPDWLTEQKSASFASIPELFRDPAHPAMNRQTTRSWLLDIWARPDTPPRRVRVEALIKTGTWIVAPMEVRILAPVVPAVTLDVTGPDVTGVDTKRAPRVTLSQAAVIEAEDIAKVEEPSSATAARQLLRYLAGLVPEMPPRILRVRDVIQRNAAEDMLLAKALEARNPRLGATVGFPELNLLAWWPFLRPAMGAEWYLRVRDFLYRFES
jgi:hypothetical protein